MMPQSTDWWPAPAKINRFLHVVGRRPDGYHLLQSLFQFVAYGDDIGFSPRNDGRIGRVDTLPDVPMEKDLTYRAAMLLKQTTGCPQGVDIQVRKRLPMGGGLGGGSSDAATVLVALNHIWRLGLGEDQLATMGLKLGADVPVFVRGRAAWAEGVGESLTPVEPDEPWVLIVHPGVAVPTAEIFSASELTRDCPPVTISAFFSGQTGNVCEPVVRQRYPEVGSVIDWLSTRAPTRMSGTGSCVFGLFADEARAQDALRELPAAWSGFVGAACNRSPLLDRLARS